MPLLPSTFPSPLATEKFSPSSPARRPARPIHWQTAGQLVGKPIRCRPNSLPSGARKAAALGARALTLLSADQMNHLPAWWLAAGHLGMRRPRRQQCPLVSGLLSAQVPAPVSAAAPPPPPPPLITLNQMNWNNKLANETASYQLTHLS